MMPIICGWLVVGVVVRVGSTGSGVFVFGVNAGGWLGRRGLAHGGMAHGGMVHLWAGTNGGGSSTRTTLLLQLNPIGGSN